MIPSRPMCMLSATVGRKNASSTLVEMTRRQEAFFGGFYTGVAVLSSHEFSLRKTVGSLEHLANQFPLKALDGSSGLAHSRTNSSGGCGRAQPFVDHAGVVAGMGTGTHGIFHGEEFARGRQSVADELLARGVQFSSTEVGLGGSARIADGRTVHNTELVVQAVGMAYADGRGMVDAIRETVARMPAEGAYVFLNRHEPDTVYVANFNYRLVYQIENEGVLVATSPMAFPASSKSFSEVPMNSIVVLRCQGDEGVQAQVGELDEDRSSCLNRDIPDGLEAAFAEYVRENPGRTWSTIIEHALLRRFEVGRAHLLVPAAFRVAEKLIATGLVQVRTVDVDGVEVGTVVPQVVFEGGKDDGGVA